MSVIDRAEIKLQLAAKRLADARVAWATAFLRFRVGAKSDNQAKAQADIEMNGAVEEAQAAYEIALAELHATRGE